MSYVNISYGTASATVEPSKVGVGCIIGVTTNDVGVINNVTASTLADTTNLPSGTGSGALTSSDPLYKAAMDYFIINPFGTLVLVGIKTDKVITVNDTAMTKVDDNNWVSQYSPVTTWADLSDNVGIKFKVKLKSAGVTEANANQAIPGTNTYDANTWYYVDANESYDEGSGAADGYSIQLDKENGVYTGGITFVDDGFSGTLSPSISIGDDGDETDTYVSFANIDGIICHATPPVFSYYMDDMTVNTVDFDAFAIGYDAEKAVGDGAGERYAATNCPSGIGYYADLTWAAAMAPQLLAMGQRVVFFAEAPVGSSYGESMDSYDAANNGKTTDQMYSIIGTNPYVSMAHTWQDSAGAANQVSSGIAEMATFLKGDYRKPLTFATCAIPASSFPSAPVASLWQNMRVNPYIQIRSTGTSCWGSNYTFGNGNEGYLNFVMCRNILANKLEEAIYNLLFKREIHIDLPSVSRLKETIKNVIDAYTGIYCDGFGGVTIPLEGYLRQGNTTMIEAAKASHSIDNISVQYIWNGDVEYININSLQGV